MSNMVASGLMFFPASSCPFLEIVSSWPYLVSSRTFLRGTCGQSLPASDQRDLGSQLGAPVARKREVISTHVSSGSSFLIEDMGNSEPLMSKSPENRNLGVNVWRAACVKRDVPRAGPSVGWFHLHGLCKLEIIILIFQIRKDSSIP